MLDIHTQEFNYNEISPPLIVNEDNMFGTGQLPKFEEDQFEIKLKSPIKENFDPYSRSCPNKSGKRYFVTFRSITSALCCFNSLFS